MSTKNVLVISSSPRKDGNSDTLSNEFIRGAKGAGHNVEKICLRDKNIGYCIGCSICSLYGKPCPQKDDMPEILNKMINADVIVMATPVYFYTMSAQMKTLIDRCCGLYTKMNNKDFYFIVTAADSNAENLKRTIDTFQGFLDCLNNTHLKGVVYGSGVWHPAEIISTKFMKDALYLGSLI